MDINQFFKNFVELLIKENIFEDNENLKEKLSNAISKYIKDGVVSKEFNEILINLFGVYDTVAREVMIPRTDMIAVPDDITLEELIKVFSEHKKSKVPVYKDNIDNIIGIVNVKDIIGYWADNKKSFNINDVLRPPYFIPETKKILDLLKEFKIKKTLFAIVVDEFGGVSGVVTIVDILEEIVGDFDYEEEDFL
jgi:CBS domain containing-hemolysin-like protein